MRDRWWLALALAGVVTVPLGALSPAGAGAVVVRTAPTLAFLLGITVVAALAEAAGVFEAAARRAAALARGRRGALWLLVVALATLTTVVLSLDTTAVLLTPVVLALARSTGSSPALFALTTVWLANTASLLLPVSNLTNLLALSELGRQGTGGTRAYLALSWPPALTALAVTAAVLAVMFRRDLTARSGVGRGSRPAGRDPVLFSCAVAVCALLVPAFLSGVPVHWSALGAALALAAVTAWRRPGVLSRRLVELPLVLGVLGLFLLVEALVENGLPAAMAAAAGGGTGAGALLRLAAVGALGANLVNNLPAYLALEGAAGAPVRILALLVGTNAGPLVTPWASLATLLWAQRCRAAGVDVAWGAFAARGLVLVPLVLLAASAALALARP